MNDKLYENQPKGGIHKLYKYDRIHDLREDADKDQKELAAILGITTQQYCLYERGDREIPFHHVITLAKYYRCSIDYIAGLTNKKHRLS